MGAGGNPKPVGGRRGEVVGWTVDAVRRHTKWLYSVDHDSLGANGWALTLTVRDCPETPEAWTALRKAYLERLRKTGVVVRSHWVVEWQRRKVPHLHMAVYLTEPVDELVAWLVLVSAWTQVSAAYGSGPHGQHLRAIDGPLGWSKYLSKHAARGVAHYQREGKPSGWERTGRLWGHTGAWPTVQPMEVRLTGPEFYRWRRLVRSRRVAAARADALTGRGKWGAVAQARRMLRTPERTRSRVIGTSNWMPESVALALLDVAAGVVGTPARARRSRPAPGTPRLPDQLRDELLSTK